MHVHVESSDGEAKFWLEPEIELARSSGFRKHRLRGISGLILLHEDLLRDAWNHYFNT